MILNSRPLDHFDTNADKRLSLEEFTELCRNLFVGTTGEEGLNSNMYDYDPEAVFRDNTNDVRNGRGSPKGDEVREVWII